MISFLFSRFKKISCCLANIRYQKQKRPIWIECTVGIRICILSISFYFLLKRSNPAEVIWAEINVIRYKRYLQFYHNVLVLTINFFIQMKSTRPLVATNG